MDLLRVVLQVIKGNQLFAKYSKCVFLLNLVVFLWHYISSERFEVDLWKTKAERNCPTPLNQTDIKSFLGLAGYYRRFVDSFASIASPLTKLTQKSKW